MKKKVFWLSILCAAALGGSTAADQNFAEKFYQYSFKDGAGIKVHFTEALLKKSGENQEFPKEVLEAAVLAYQTIVEFQGFSTHGYSFASADKNYAYDPDKTIDIYLGDPADDTFEAQGFKGAVFKDVPCFDTVRVSKTAFQAVILLPVRYGEFIRNWERMNPSSLGTRNVKVDLRGTLMHEMLHAILFYYNRNLNKDLEVETPNKSVAGEHVSSKQIDWYVEGLARYFETFGGARHDFFSQGFKQVMPTKIRFSRGGSNYYMRYPDQAFTRLRYENALFWRFIDYHYGMPAIERLSRDLRSEPKNNDYKTALEKVTGMRFEKILENFSEAILFKDFGLKEDSEYLKNVAKIELSYRKGNLYLEDGWGAERFLGKICDTDWIGRWENVRAKFGEFPAAGDNTDEADVSAWATDFVEIDFKRNNEPLPQIEIFHKEGGTALAVKYLLVTKTGTVIKKDLGDIPARQERGAGLGGILKQEGLAADDLGKLYLLITNVDSKESARYEIRIKS